MINNDFYEELGDQWHSASAHPVALLRAENALRNPWIASRLPAKSRVLDVGCGAGLLTNFLASQGHEVHGVDLSASSLKVAMDKDETRSVRYGVANAASLSYPDAAFDAVCAMDLLEHVENPLLVIEEASRVLKPGGLFFFHTFNRNFFSWLIVIKGVEWCVKNTPQNMHVYPLFITPCELTQMSARCSLFVEEIKGVRPNFATRAFWKMLFTRRVPEDFEFQFTSSLMTGYSGVSRKKSS